MNPVTLYYMNLANQFAVADGQLNRYVTNLALAGRINTVYYPRYTYYTGGGVGVYRR